MSRLPANTVPACCDATIDGSIPLVMCVGDHHDVLSPVVHARCMPSMGGMYDHTDNFWLCEDCTRAFRGGLIIDQYTAAKWADMCKKYRNAYNVYLDWPNVPFVWRDGEVIYDVEEGLEAGDDGYNGEDGDDEESDTDDDDDEDDEGDADDADDDGDGDNQKVLHGSLNSHGDEKAHDSNGGGDESDEAEAEDEDEDEDEDDGDFVPEGGSDAQERAFQADMEQAKRNSLREVRNTQPFSAPGPSPAPQASSSASASMAASSPSKPRPSTARARNATKPTASAPKTIISKQPQKPTGDKGTVGRSIKWTTDETWLLGKQMRRLIRANKPKGGEPKYKELSRILDDLHGIVKPWKAVKAQYNRTGMRKYFGEERNDTPDGSKRKSVTCARENKKDVIYIPPYFDSSADESTPKNPSTKRAPKLPPKPAAPAPPKRSRETDSEDEDEDVQRPSKRKRS